MENAGCENGYLDFVIVCEESNKRKSESSVKDEIHIIGNFADDGTIDNFNTIQKTSIEDIQFL